MVWNPLRWLQTLAHFEVVGPLMGGPGRLPEPGSTAGASAADELASALMTPPRLKAWLMPNGPRVSPTLAATVATWGYDLEVAELKAEPLVNTAAVLCPATGESLAAAIAHLSQTPACQETLLVDFRTVSPAIAALWGSLDDGVMGGVSASQVQWREGLRFGGQVSTANNGGFASIRTCNIEPPLNLSQWQGTVLHLQGDGQRYKWILRANPGWDSLAYCRSFDTDAESLVTVRTPFREMVATRRARTVPDAPPLNPGQIYSMQLMLSKFEYDGTLNPAFQAGTFGLAVQRLGVFRQGPKPLVMLPGGTAELGPALAAAGLTGAIPQGDTFGVIGASTQLPPTVNPAVVQAIFQVLGADS